MKPKHILLIAFLALPAGAEEKPTPQPPPKPAAATLTTKTVEKLGAVIDAKAEFDRTQAALQTDRVAPIKMDGGMIIALPDPGEDPAEFINRIKNITSTQLGGHLAEHIGGELFPPKTDFGAGTINLYMQIQSLKAESARLAVELSAANDKIDWLLKIIERERLAQGKDAKPKTAESGCRTKKLGG